MLVGGKGSEENMGRMWVWNVKGGETNQEYEGYVEENVSKMVMGQLGSVAVCM